MTLWLLLACFDVAPDQVEDFPWTDQDGDGFDSEREGDCDDADPLVYPGAPELCDDGDNDCDDSTPALVESAWYADLDGDGFGVEEDVISSCYVEAGRSTTSGDCADDDPSVHPDATERCNLADDDCDGDIDEAPEDPDVWYTDADGDGFGDDASFQEGCLPDSGVVATGGDCNDADAMIWPDAPELCDDIDNDCDLAVDEELNATGWVALDPIPGPLAHGQAVASDTHIYLLGGAVSGSDFNSWDQNIYAAALEEGSLGAWETVGTLPAAIANYGATYHDGRIYLASAWSSSYNSWASTESDGSVSSWSNLALAPSSGENAGVLISDDWLYILGARSDEVAHAALDSDLGWSETWSTDRDLPRESGANTASAARDGYLYVGAPRNDGGGPYPELYVGTLEAGGAVARWDTVAAPGAMNNLVLVGDTLVVFHENGSTEPMTVYAAPFSLGEVGEFQQLPSYPYYTSGAHSVVVGTRLYLFGGDVGGVGYVGSTEAWYLDLCDPSTAADQESCPSGMTRVEDPTSSTGVEAFCIDDAVQAHEEPDEARDACEARTPAADVCGIAELTLAHDAGHEFGQSGDKIATLESEGCCCPCQGTECGDSYAYDMFEVSNGAPQCECWCASHVTEYLCCSEAP